MQAVTLNIDDISCGGYVKNVTRILEGIDGIDKTEVSFESKDAAVTFDPAKTSPDALIEVVEDDGFDASR